jgi:hypothetical protein
MHKFSILLVFGVFIVFALLINNSGTKAEQPTDTISFRGSNMRVYNLVDNTTGITYRAFVFDRSLIIIPNSATTARIESL